MVKLVIKLILFTVPLLLCLHYGHHFAHVRCLENMSSIVQCAHGHTTVYFNSARMVTICTTSNWLYTIVRSATFKPRGSQCEYMYIMHNTHLKTGLQATDMKRKMHFNLAEERTA